MKRDELLDRAEIQELMNRYAWMVDMKKWEMIDEVFTSDATVDSAGDPRPVAIGETITYRLQMRLPEGGAQDRNR